MNARTSWKTNLSNQTTSLLRPLWLGTYGGLNSEVLLYLQVGQIVKNGLNTLKSKMYNEFLLSFNSIEHK